MSSCFLNRWIRWSFFKDPNLNENVFSGSSAGKYSKPLNHDKFDTHNNFRENRPKKWDVYLTKAETESEWLKKAAREMRKEPFVLSGLTPQPLQEHHSSYQLPPPSPTHQRCQISTETQNSLLEKQQSSLEKASRHILLTTCPQFTNEYGQAQLKQKKWTKTTKPHWIVIYSKSLTFLWFSNQ